ncbi:Transglutaminase-like enzyme, putative cysteine protease [Actinopolyspora xinjiangensis]|uniref:Transglutaminase-like enzyme, putative cysteine protease n=1 Tax=Actinopolyspora xinjiangensis TaxID=405564 RepID=A0A1H0ST07_9ACTN|nr:DUF3488 and transglutaminase-like domain-containing protein [Actinopolyspora xinjiangensis]SDP44912.1 Transglutaminase-like enzyme, putative cysteine protease [Actinopolyspora xinjiangensis]
MNRTGSDRHLTGLLALSAVLLTSTAFSAVLADWRWFPPAAMTAVVVSCTGIATRMKRDSWWSAPLQLAALVFMLTALFGGSGFLGLIPTPATFAELAHLLGDAIEVVRTGIPPVPAETAISCLICLGIGVVTLLVDRIAVTGRAPAVAGLVLLCVFAVPASLADRMLPWWTFLGSAAGFTAMLSAGSGFRLTADSRWSSVRRFSEPVAVTSVACVVALLTGTVFTGVGTQGRLPGSDPDQAAPDTGEIGLRPFTSLRGQLDRDEPVELFRIEGLPRETYLRAMTLSRFDPERGWRLGSLPEGIPARERLPLPPGTKQRSSSPTHRVEIEPVGYRDAWLPVFGVPRRVLGIGDAWRYDPASGMIFTRRTDDTDSYTELAAFPDPSREKLRASSGDSPVDQVYLETSGAGERVRELARRITANAENRFDRAVALNDYFTDPANGFTYDLSTAPASSHDALEDFLFRGKRGYCEQFASAMAVLLREVGIPSRVAVGFTSGRDEGDERVITTEDAHAWVEAHFPGHGWITFDPTPLREGRGSVPPYLAPSRQREEGERSSAPTGEPTTPSATPDSDEEKQDTSRTASEEPGHSGVPVGALLTGGTALLLGTVLTAPAAMRTLRRRRRWSLASSGGIGAAGNAWRELLDESIDRGDVSPPPGETPRRTAERVIESYGVPPEAAEAWHELASAVDRERYGPPGGRETGSRREALHRAVSGLRAVRPLDFRERLLPRSTRVSSTRRRPPARR